MNFEILKGILIPFFGTSLGAACVFFLKKDLNPRLETLLNGFAAGVMAAASIWSLLLPAIDRSAHLGHLAFLPAAGGFLSGTLLLLLLDHALTQIRPDAAEKTSMMIFTITLHNIPEGMAVGAIYAGWLMGDGAVTLAGALALSIGIAIQNFPEGAVVSLPLRAAGFRRKKIIHRRRSVWSCRTCRRCPDHLFIRTDHTGSALFTQLCRRRYDLCGGGRTDPGIARA